MNIDIDLFNQPGHASVLHGCLTFEEPGQPQFPTHNLSLSLIPPPHDFVQDDHGLQCAQLPSSNVVVRQQIVFKDPEIIF